MQSVSHIETNKEISTTEKITISIPISIPKSNSYDDYIEEYALKCNNFNPSKMSPPDTWKCRLEQRMKLFQGDSYCKE